MLDGARLYVDVVEINPPLIVLLNVPAVLLGRWMGVPSILAYRLGFALVLVLLLALSARALRRLLPNETSLRRAILLLLIFVLFPLSAQDFGQREHLLLALLAPYLLLAAARALGRPVSALEAFAVGLVAGVGFALKPHFLLVWIGVESYLKLRRRPGDPVLLPESVAIAMLLAIYAVGVLVLTPEYPRLVAQLASPYTRFLHDSFGHLLVTGPGAVLSIFALLAYLALRRNAGHPELWALVAVGLLTCWLAAAAQQKGLRYHFYPSFALAIVLLGLVALDQRQGGNGLPQRLYRRLSVALVVTALVVVLAANAAKALRVGPDPAGESFAKLVALVRELGRNGRLYVMSYHIGSAYPLVNYSGVPSASRFPQLWILAAEYRSALESPAPLRYHAPVEMSESERYLNRAVREDLVANRPAVLVVLRNARDLPVNGYRRLDYIAYFRRDPVVSAILDRYQWVVDVGDYAVFQRIPEGQARADRPPAAEPGTQDVIRADTSGPNFASRDPTLLLSLLTFVVALGAVTIHDRARRVS